MDASSNSQDKSVGITKKKYVSPELTDYGTVRQQTQTGTNSPIVIGDGTTLSS